MLRRDARRTEANKAVVRDYFAAWNRGDVEALARSCAGAVHHSRFRRYHADAVAAANEPVRSACPDLRLEIEDLLADGDKVIARMTARGTHDRPFLGLPATGKEVAFELIEILRVADAKIVERWGLSDELFALEQFGFGRASAGRDAPPSRIHRGRKRSTRELQVDEA